MTHVKGGGRIAGAPELTLRFTRLEVDGNDYPIAADPWRVKGTDDLGESVAEIGGGAVVGGVVGGIAGHGSTKGIVTGAAVGAVLGTGVAVAMLFIAGEVLGHYAGARRWRGGFWMAVTGILLMGAIMALGG